MTNQRYGSGPKARCNVLVAVWTLSVLSNQGRAFGTTRMSIGTTEKAVSPYFCSHVGEHSPGAEADRLCSGSPFSTPNTGDPRDQYLDHPDLDCTQLDALILAAGVNGPASIGTSSTVAVLDLLPIRSDFSSIVTCIN